MKWENSFWNDRLCAIDDITCNRAMRAGETAGLCFFESFFIIMLVA